MSDFVCEEVLIDIFYRLPIKTLIRCTSVCKSWYSLLTNPSFITSHLNRPVLAKYSNRDDLLLVRSVVICSKEQSEEQTEERYSVYSDTEAFNEFAKLEFPFKSWANGHFRIIGSCNGLICFSDDMLCILHTTVLWNPSIRKSVTLPRPRVTFCSHGPFRHVFGFGFDPLTNDYKVIRIVYLQANDGINFDIMPPEIDIFTVNIGTWRNISHLGLSFDIIDRKRQAYVNGATHWLAVDRTKGFKHLIVSFNITDEVFHEINVPGINCGAGWLPYVDIVNFQGSLSLFERNLHSIGMNYCIWVMKEYGVAKTWTKQIVVDLHLYGRDMKCFVGFRKNGEVLLARRGGNLEYYDSNAKRCKDLGIHCPAESFSGSPLYSDAYKESLVLLGVASTAGDACEEYADLNEEMEEQEIKMEKEGKAENS